MATRTYGADGPSMNFSTPQGGTVKFILKSGSPVVKIMYEMVNRQMNLPCLFPIVIMCEDREVFNFKGCAFGNQTVVAEGHSFSLEFLKFIPPAP